MLKYISGVDQLLRTFLGACKILLKCIRIETEGVAPAELQEGLKQFDVKNTEAVRDAPAVGAKKAIEETRVLKGADRKEGALQRKLEKGRNKLLKAGTREEDGEEKQEKEESD